MYIKNLFMLIVTLIFFFRHSIIKYLKHLTLFFGKERHFKWELYLHLCILADTLAQTDLHCIRGIYFVLVQTQGIMI